MSHRGADRVRGRAAVCGRPLRGARNRQRIHAAAQRRRPDVHADRGSEHLAGGEHAERESQNAILQSFPEVAYAVAKVARADTSTDPAPLNMTETIVHLKPRDQWRPGMTRRSSPCRHESGRATAGHLDYLDDAHHQSHRHVDDRHSVRGRREDVRQRSDGSGVVRSTDRRCRPYVCRARATSIPSRSRAASTSTSSSIAPRRRGTASVSATFSKSSKPPLGRPC